MQDQDGVIARWVERAERDICQAGARYASPKLKRQIAEFEALIRYGVSHLSDSNQKTHLGGRYVWAVVIQHERQTLASC